MSAQPGKAAHSTPDRRRRRYPRYRSNFPVVLKLFVGGKHEQMEAHCKDLSEAGIGVLLAAELNSGEVVTLDFSLPGSQAAWAVRGVLRHRRGYHYGFEFLSLSSEQSEFLKKHLLTLARADQD